LTTYQVVDPSALWVHDQFYQYAEKVQLESIRHSDQEYRSGDISREVVYQTSDDNLQVFKNLLREAKRRFF